jgi:hypothetical protein
MRISRWRRLKCWQLWSFTPSACASCPPGHRTRLTRRFLRVWPLAALVWLQTALVRSDISQIVLAFTPVIVILSLLAKMEWTSPSHHKGVLSKTVTELMGHSTVRTQFIYIQGVDEEKRRAAELLAGELARIGQKSDPTGVKSVN